MTPFQDYPRMLFHRSGLTCVVLSRDEEDGLGADWRRTVWPAEAAPLPVETATGLPTASADPEPEDGDPWGTREPFVPDDDALSAFEPTPKPKRMKKR
jgi:hypothetical protein